MPIDNLGKKHFTDEQIQGINESLDSIIQTLTGMSVHLEPAERTKYGKIKEQNKLLVNKVKQFHEGQPDLRSPEVDWDEFDKDYRDRAQASQMLAKMKSAEILLMNIKVLGDYDNYADALRDYKYAKYKSSFESGGGFAVKMGALKVFFANTGKRKKDKGIAG